MDKLKTQHKKGVSSLTEKVQKQKAPSDSSIAQQVAEQKLAEERQEKCDQLVSSANKKHQREVEEWRVEKEQLEARMEAIERKYASLRTRAVEMKDHYEDLLAQERETGRGGADSHAVVSEVKKIMNSVYQTLRTKFASDETYAGADIHSTILHAIKTVTLQLVERQKTQGEEVSRESERGNQQTMEERIEAMMSPETSQKPVKSKVLEDRIEAMMYDGSTGKKPDQAVEETVRAVAASVTGGGGGNPHYAAELEGAGKPPTVEVIQQVVATHTGHHGNPHYAAELAAGKPQKDIEPVVAAQVTSQLAGKAPGKEQIKPVPAKTTGGGGGNPHYLTQLGVEDVEKKVQRDVEPVVAAQVVSPLAGKAPGKGEIKAVAAQVTGGGGGNPHYAAELEKGGKDQSKDMGDVIKPVVAMTTGDKGNRHYAEELSRSHQHENAGSDAGKTNKGKNPVKREEKKDSSKQSGSKMAADKMDTVFVGIADAMEHTSKTADKKSKKPASKETLKQESILAATDALFSDPFFDASLPQTVTAQDSKKHKAKSQSKKPVPGRDDDLAARLGIITTEGGKSKASKDTTIKSSSGNSHSDDDLKPRPPPQPLFLDDDDDNDLDWLK